MKIFIESFSTTGNISSGIDCQDITPTTTTKNKNSSAFRVADKRIISINAELFYEKITDKKDMLKSIYQRIPEIFLSIDKKKYLLSAGLRNPKKIIDKYGTKK